MDVTKEHSIISIKNKMTEIRRNRKGNIFHNYYNNCDSCTEIFALYGNNTVVFWHHDNSLVRGYFYSSDCEELRKLLNYLPAGCIIDYLTRVKDEFLDLLSDSGLTLLYEMHRLSTAGLTEEEKNEIARKKDILKKSLYRPQNVRCAGMKDLDVIYDKLYEIFDPRESHLPSKEELVQFITNGWISVYCENGMISGIYIFKVERGGFYSYQIWNGAGAEGYFSLSINSKMLYEQYLQKFGEFPIKYDFSWVNVKNKKSKRLLEYWGEKFDGLYDFVYERTVLNSEKE